MFGLVYFVVLFIFLCTSLEWVFVNDHLLVWSCTDVFAMNPEKSVIYEISIILKSEEMIIDDVSINGARFPSFNVPEGFHQVQDILSLIRCKTIASCSYKYQSGAFQPKM